MTNTQEDDKHEMTNAETLKEIKCLQKIGLFNIILVLKQRMIKCKRLGILHRLL